MKNFIKTKSSIVTIMLIFLMVASSITVSAKSFLYDNRHDEYEVKNEKLMLKYRIADLKVEKGILEFNFEMNKEETKNVYSVNIEVKDATGKVLTDSPEEAEGYYTEKIVYKADISDDSIEKVEIVVYAFSEEFKSVNINEVDMRKVPHNSTIVDIKNLKKSDIKANGGESKESFIKSFLKSNGFTIVLAVILFTVYLIYKNKTKERKQINDRKQK